MNPDLNRVLDSMRADTGDESAAAATAHVRARLEAEMGESAAVDRLNSCGDFRALFGAYRSRALSEARQMLVEDHLHSCVACRNVYRHKIDQDPVNVPSHAVFPYAASKPFVRRAIPWVLAAAAVGILGVALAPMLDRLLAGSGPRATVASVTGDLYRVADSAPLASGAPVQEGEEIRTGKDSHAVVRLRDGSMVEMAERSDLRIAERFSGKVVHLDRGALMIEAAKQRRGYLQIATADCLVSVKGTIFEVTAGTKGSRVSVVEGAVKVDGAGASDLLHRGDQKTTNPSMEAIPVADDVAWSRNSAKYLALLGELSVIQKRIEQLPGPALRYESKLAGLLPADTVAFAAIPNPGETLSEATGIFEERVAQNETLRQWWNQQNSRQLRAIVEQARAITDYLGDEVVLALPRGAHGPLLVAETRKPGLREYLLKQGVPLGRVEGGPKVMVHDTIVAIGLDPATLNGVVANVDAGGHGPFLETPFWKTIAHGYESGAGWIFAADMEQILANHVQSSQSAMTGLDNVQYLMIERKPNLGRTENSATLSFRGERHGIASWLGAPGPMGTLDFVSPQASFAGSFVVKNPATLLQDVANLLGPQNAALLDQLSGPNLNDVAANLGGEVTIAIDGPLLPIPSVKVAIEVVNPAMLEAAIERLVKMADSLELSSEPVNGQTYYKLSSRVSYQMTPEHAGPFGADKLSLSLPQGIEIDYAFVDGYLLLATSRAALASAIQTRATGLTLPRSATFRAQLPQDQHANFSALLYYNAGVQLGPILDQLKARGLATPEQQKSMDVLAANREPGLIYAYGEPGRIFAGSRGGFFGLGLDTLVGLNAKGGEGLMHLLPPLLSMHGSRN